MLRFSLNLIFILIGGDQFQCMAQSMIRYDSSTILLIKGKDSILIDDPLDKNNILGAPAEFYYRDNIEEFLKINLRYPEEAIKNNIEGVVTIYAELNWGGKLNDIRVGHSVHPLLDAEALRIVKSMSNWEVENLATIVFLIPFKL